MISTDSPSGWGYGPTLPMRYVASNEDFVTQEGH